MENNRIILIFNNHINKTEVDLDVPLDISANDFILGLKQVFELNMDISNLSQCFFRTENPIALLKGEKTLKEYGLRNGTIVHYL